MKLVDLVGKIQDHASIKKKFLLHDVLKVLTNARFNKARVFRDIGEDAAAIYSGDELLLIATDIISPALATRDPRAAGYSAILVGVDDIYACGGTPVAASLNVQATSPDRALAMIKGATFAAEQFTIPIVRGHTSTSDPCDGVSSTVIGECPTGRHVSAGGARDTDLVVLIWDPDGKRSPNGPFWDTVTFKPSPDVMQKRATMVELATAGLLHASKDVSDAGLVGTLLMMIDHSRTGASIDVGLLLDMFGARTLEDLYWWLTAYMTTGFLTTAAPGDVDDIVTIASAHEMTARAIGTITTGHELVLHHGSETLVAFDRDRHPIFP